MSIIKLVVFLFATLFVAIHLSGCASFGRKLKSMMGGSDASEQKSQRAQGPSFASQPNFNMARDKHYKKVTKDNFTDEQALEENSGSLWKKVGQSGYLFSQNNLRMMGDIINVEVEGKASENVTAKLSAIKKALARFEAPPMQRPRPNRAPAQGVPKPEDKNAQNTQQTSPVEEEKSKEQPKEETKESSKFDNVPCRIVERNGDGSYRVKGQQTIFVGLHEYRLIVTGIVRPDDISQDIISSSKLIDSKFDLVASTKEAPAAVPR